MPNWCNNIVTLTHEDPAQIKRVVDSLQVGLFNEFIPMPDQLRNTEMSTATPEEVYAKNVQDCGYPSWYEFAIAEWDTKWDACTPDILAQTDTSIKLTFDTAWSPPIAVFDKLHELGFDVEAYYHEGGMAYYGEYITGCNSSGEYDGSSLETLRDTCPAHIIEMFSLEDWYDEEDETE